MAQEEIIDAKDVAKRLKISYRTVVRLAERGELPAFRIGDLWRFRSGDIDEYIENQIRRRSEEIGNNPPT